MKNKNKYMWVASLGLAFLITQCESSSFTDTAEDSVSTFTLLGSSGSDADASESSAEGLNLSVSPSSLNVKVYSLAVSTDEFCTNPITVFTNDDPEEVDLADNPTLGAGEIPDGTYPCVMIEMTDTFSYVPDATEGACVAGEVASKGVCDEAPILMFDGTESDCTSGEDIVTLYISTANTIVTPQDYIDAGCDEDADCNGFMPPTAEILTRGGALGSALVVSGDQAGTFVVDLNNGLESVTNNDVEQCSIEDIRFSFE